MDPNEQQCATTKLECPICFKQFRPPIFLCSTGHTLCRNCCKKLTYCPFCLSILNKNIRNYYLEDLCAIFFKYPCKFKNFGCERIIQLTEIKEHERVCIYKNFQCLIGDGECSFNHNTLETIKHIRTNHADYIVKDDFDDTSFLCMFEQIASFNKKCLIITRDNVLFEICYNAEQKDFHVHSLNLFRQNYFNLHYYYKDEDVEINVSMNELCLSYNDTCCWDKQNVNIGNFTRNISTLNSTMVNKFKNGRFTVSFGSR